MASINSLMSSGSSSTSSIFGNRNVISGLASGMDTESMIENAVSGYKMKISKLQQQRVKMEWQQTAYRNMIEKMVHFNQKYLSYASGNNLMSSSFFDSAVKTIANGANANKVSVSGRTSSSVSVNSITSLATSAKYTSKPTENTNLKPSNEATGTFDVTETTSTGKLDGYMSIGYGGKTVQIRFDDTDAFDDANAMAKAINEKLEKQTITFDNGDQVKASERIKAVVDGDKITFKNVKGDGNSVWISSASESVKTALEIEPSSGNMDLTSFTFDAAKVKEDKALVDVLSEKGFTITLNGETKTIQGPTKDELGASWTDADYIAKLQEKIDQEFGKTADGKSRLEVKDVDGAANNEVKLAFVAANPNDRFAVTSTADKLMGMEGGLSSSINTHRKLGDLLKDSVWGNMKPVKQDENGNDLYALELNGKTVGTFSKESTLDDVLTEINSSKDSPFKVSYSNFTQEFLIEAKETGAKGELQLGGGLAEALFGKTNEIEKGQDATFEITVNNRTQTITQSSNTIEIDGMTITMKDTFAAGEEKITFGTESDPDKVVDVVKKMVEDYNAMAKEIKDAYSTIPLQNSKGNYYEPLTDEDRAEMSESAIKAYEEKAKTGILFADRDLSNLYRDMTSALGVLGATGNDGLKLGLTTSFENGITTLDFDEEQFRNALETDPDKVKKVFTSNVENGDPSNGLMAGIQNQLEKYASTTGAVKGILIEKAGSPLAPTSVLQNTMQQKLDSLDKQVDALRSKMTKQVDYYNRKFTALEQLVLQMNSQSASLMGMMGGY